MFSQSITSRTVSSPKMPPSLSRSSLSSLTRCQSCSALSTTSRAFSTSQPLSKIGPESPKFIEIPKLVQPRAHSPRIVKGVLPTPRSVFPKRSGVDKTSLQYLASATPEPSSDRAFQEPATPYVAWKRQMAEKRRQNLREGLVGLYERKRRTDAAVERRSQAKQEDRERRLYAPMREDERLMNSTIMAANSQLQVGNLPDPNRVQRLAESAARVRAKEQEREERRQDALHTLYMHARSFITTEAQLDAEIDKVFTDKPFADSLYGRNTDNIWDALGAPPTVQTLLEGVNRNQRETMEYHKGPAIPTAKRMMKLAEELTGGKMD